MLETDEKHAACLDDTGPFNAPQNKTFLAAFVVSYITWPKKSVMTVLARTSYDCVGLSSSHLLSRKSATLSESLRLAPCNLKNQASGTTALNTVQLYCGHG